MFTNLKSIFSCPEVLNTLTGLWADADTDRLFFEWLEEQCEEYCTDDFDQLAEMLVEAAESEPECDNSDAVDVEAVVVQMDDDAVQYEQWEQRESDRRDYWETQYDF